MKISVGIPAYDGKIPVQLARCLLTETSIAAHSGDFLTVRFLPSCTNLALGRNQLVKEFLASEDERIVFVDADVTFEPGSLLKVAHYPVDVVGGAYRLKQAREWYPVGFLPGELRADETGLLPVASIPTGFMSLSRNAFETFKAMYPGREYMIQGLPAYCYFQIPFKDGALYTEDVYFCREWFEAGGKVYVDPEMTLTHWDANTPFKGHMGEWLRRQSGILPTLNKEAS